MDTRRSFRLLPRMSWLGASANEAEDSCQQSSTAVDEFLVDEDEEFQYLRMFVPRDLLGRLLEAPESPLDASGELLEMQAAVGFFDISGFTKLSTDLFNKEVASKTVMAGRHRRSSFGAIGSGEKDAFAMAMDRGPSAEVLASHINKMFGAVIGVIEKHGGDIIKFVGDAMIVLWPTATLRTKKTSHNITVAETTEEELDRVALVAASCAIEAVKGMERLENNFLGIHIGIAVGQVRRCIVGTTRCETFLAGEACLDTFRSLDHAKVGEIVVPRETWRRLASSCHGTAAASPIDSSSTYLKLDSLPPIAANSVVKPLPPLPQPTQELARLVTMFLPKPFVAALDPDRGGARCEMRTVGVLFVSITGVTTTDNAAFLSSVQGIMCALFDACHRHGACLRQFVYDDKGLVAVICGGLPSSPSSRESGAVVAEPAACVFKVVASLRNTHRHLYDTSKFGITTGSCFCGPVGATNNTVDGDEDEEEVDGEMGRQEYAVVGDAVNLSARLMSKTDVGSVRVDAASRNVMVRHGFDFERLADFTPKGKTQPVENYALLLKDTSSGAGDTPSAAKAIANAAVIRTMQSIAASKRGEVVSPEDDTHTSTCPIAADPFANADRFVDRGGAYSAVKRLCQSSEAKDAVESLVVAGGTGHGKTTFLEVCTNCLSTVQILTLYAACEATDCERKFSSLRSIFSGAVRILLHASRKSSSRELLNDAPPDSTRIAKITESSQPSRTVVLWKNKRRSCADKPRDEGPVTSRAMLQLEALEATGYITQRDVPYLRDILEARSQPPARTTDKDDDDEVCSLLQRLLEACVAVGEGVALLIDDGHYCDKSSCQLLCRLRTKMPLVRVVITHRPLLATKRDFERLLTHLGCATNLSVGSVETAPSQNRPFSWASKKRREVVHPSELIPSTTGCPTDGIPADRGRVVVVTLGPLNLLQMRKLVASAVEGVGEVQQDLVDFALRRSSGNPYAALAIVADLKDKEFVSLDENNGKLSLNKDVRDLSFEVPETVRSAVTTAFDALDSPKQALLRLASTLGSRIDVACLAFLFWHFFRATHIRSSSRTAVGGGGSFLDDDSMTVTNSPRRYNPLTFDVHGAIDFRSDCLELVRLRYLDFPQSNTAGGRQQLRFCRDLTRQVIYNQMLATDRKFVHAQIVNWHAFKLATSASSKITTINFARLPPRSPEEHPSLSPNDDENEIKHCLNDKPEDMAVLGEIAYHALCADQAVLAFHFCVGAFFLAVKYKLVDVALGYVNDCEGISENRALPSSLHVGAQLAMMRAVLKVHQGDYEAAVASLDDFLSDTKEYKRRRRIWSLMGPFIRYHRDSFPRIASSRSQRIDFARCGLEKEGGECSLSRDERISLDVPMDNSAIAAYREFALVAAGNRRLHARLGSLHANIKRAQKSMRRAKGRLEKSMDYLDNRWSVSSSSSPHRIINNSSSIK